MAGPRRRGLTLAAAVLAAALTLLALSAAALWLPAPGAAAPGAAASATARVPASAARMTGQVTGQGGQGAAGPRTGGTPRTVVLAGIPGLRWTDLSQQATPNLWRLASAGSVGSLVVRTVATRTCPADGWLTLNSGARAEAPRSSPHQCGAIPPPSALGGLAGFNRRFHQDPKWGLLGSAAGRGCVSAIGPGGALALAPASRRPGTQSLPAAADVSRPFLARCPLTVADLGAVPAGHGRAAVVRARDRELGRIAASLPPGALLAVAAPADDGAAHLRVLVVDGPGYRAGLLRSSSTRQPGLVDIRDLTASVLTWRGSKIPSGVAGAEVTRSGRGSLTAAIRGLTGQDTQAQVWQATEPLFFATFAVTEGVVFIAVGLILWGDSAERRGRRAAIWRVLGVCAGSVPAGTFLASLVPWWTMPHPAVLLYAMAVGWAAVLAAIALAGPWRRDPLGPPGVVGAVTVAVLGADVMTGSRLQMGTPFGLNVLDAGRFYGLGNNAIGLYGAAGMLAAGWLAGRALRSARAARRKAVLAVTAVAVFAVIASGLFGSKFGGTIALVPGFLLIGLAVAGARISPRRAVLVSLSGVAAVVVLSLATYFVPVTGHSDITAFVGQALHGSGGAGDTLRRKITANIGSLALTPYSPLVPVVVAGIGLILVRPSWFRAKTLMRARASVPLLGPVLAAIWIVGVLGWLADDSGVTVTAAALPLALPLAISAMAAVPPASASPVDPDVPVEAATPSPGRPRDPA